MGLHQGEAGALPPIDAGLGLGGLQSRDRPGVEEVVPVVVVGGGEEGEDRSHLPQEEGVARNKWAVDCSNRDVGAGIPMVVAVDGGAGTGKDRVDRREGAEAPHHSNRVAVGRCQEAGTGLDTGLPLEASGGDRVHEVVAVEGAEGEESRGW